MQKTDKILILGHNGMVGNSLYIKLSNENYSNIITIDLPDLDLRDQKATNTFFNDIKPEYVFLCAAKVGGILANKSYPAEFIYDNIAIQTNVIHAAHINKVQKLLFLGSSCIYPKFAVQPIVENQLLQGALEETNEAYAIAKIAGLKMCQFYKEQYGDNFISVMPTNLYGERDNFDLQNSHVLPALIRKFHEAKKNNEQSVKIWGTGTPLREFLHVRDLVDALVFLMQNYDGKEHINIGTGLEISIKDLALMISDIVGFKGLIEFDNNMPDGTPRKLLSVNKLKELGWIHSISLEDGIKQVYLHYIKNISKK